MGGGRGLFPRSLTDLIRQKTDFLGEVLRPEPETDQEAVSGSHSPPWG